MPNPKLSSSSPFPLKTEKAALGTTLTVTALSIEPESIDLRSDDDWLSLSRDTAKNQSEPASSVAKKFFRMTPEAAKRGQDWYR